jgi:hypothetical protein
MEGSGVRCVLLLGENIKNSVSLLVLSNKVGLEVHGQKTKYIFMSFNRDAQQNHNTHTNKCKRSPVTGPLWPRGFQEV